MPWCSGKVTVPLGCSTALVMNKRPGHAPQLPPAVAALAGMAIALAGMAMAISVMNPSAILTNLILRNVVIFIGCPFLWRGRQRSPLLRSPLLVCTAAQVLGLAGTPGRGEAAHPGLTNALGGHAKPGRLLPPGAKRHAVRNAYEVIRGGRRPQFWSTANGGRGGYHGRAKLGRTRREPIRMRRGGGVAQAWPSACGDRAGMTATGDAGGEHACRSVSLDPYRGQQPFEVLTARAARPQVHRHTRAALIHRSTGSGQLGVDVQHFHRLAAAHIPRIRAQEAVER